MCSRNYFPLFLQEKIMDHISECVFFTKHSTLIMENKTKELNALCILQLT